MIAELLLFGASHHFNRDYDWNEINLGIGASAVFTEYRAADVSPTISTGVYKDSYGGCARFAMPGVRWSPNDWLHAGISYGYYEGSSFNGLGCIPYVGFKYHDAALNFTGFYRSKETKDNVAYGPAIAVFFSIPVFNNE